MLAAVEFKWEKFEGLSLDHLGELNFPEVGRLPGVYRLFTKSEVYVGESAKIQRRFANYRKPGGSPTTKVPRTNRHVNRWLIEKIQNEDETNQPSIEICVAATMRFDSGEMVAVDFNNKDVRLALENLTIERDRRNGLKFVNLKVQPNIEPK